METKLVWLPVEWAKKVEEASSSETKEAILLEYCSRLKGECKLEVENLDDEVAVIRGTAAKYRQALRDVLAEHISGTEQIWEQVSSKRGDILRFIDEVNKAVEQFRGEVEGLSRKLDVLPLHQFRELVALMEQVQRSLEGPGKRAIEALVDYNKKKES